MQRIKIEWTQFRRFAAKTKSEEVYFTVAQFCLPDLSRRGLPQTSVSVQDSQMFRTKHKLCQSEFKNDFWLFLKGVAMQQVTDEKLFFVGSKKNTLKFQFRRADTQIY